MIVQAILLKNAISKNPRQSLNIRKRPYKIEENLKKPYN